MNIGEEGAGRVQGVQRPTNTEMLRLRTSPAPSGAPRSDLGPPLERGGALSPTAKNPTLAVPDHVNSTALAQARVEGSSAGRDY